MSIVGEASSSKTEAGASMATCSPLFALVYGSQTFIFQELSGCNCCVSPLNLLLFYGMKIKALKAVNVGREKPGNQLEKLSDGADTQLPLTL